MLRTLRLLVGGLVLAMGLVGCGGGGSSNGGGGGAFPFAGTFNGSDVGTASVNSDSITISETGVLTGTSTAVIGGGDNSTIAGTVTSKGVVNMSVTSPGGNSTATGTAAFNASGDLVLTLTTTGGSVFATFTKSTVTTSLFAGTYSGPFTSVNTGGGGNTSGTVTMTVSSNGTITGTATPSGSAAVTLSGTVTALGAVNVKTSSSTGLGSTGGAAFNASGQLVFIVSNADATTTLTLTKS